MNIAVMGAGAVGCYYGGMLARAGHDVSLVGRALHMEAVHRAGLFLETASFQAHLAMRTNTEPSGVRGAQLVLFCVKSTDTERAGSLMAPNLNTDASVLSLQNGVDNAARLQAVLARPVIPGVVYVAAQMVGPGHVRHLGRGELVIGPAVASARLVTLFSHAGIPAHISDNVAGALWAKLILNCAYNALSAIAQLPYGRLIEEEGVEDLMRTVLAECLAVAQADGVLVPGDPWTEVLRIAHTMSAQYSSTAQDLARGKRSEIDHLNGYVVRRGLALSVPTPANRVLHTLVKLLESRAASERR
jgi:2-dehydropantoate 2-reductase